MPPSTSLKLRPADQFDLIRWLARSQSDPRKAVAELVQNSLDANARRVSIERRRVRRAPALVIRDDGEGIVPELSREAALRAIATNIGHSRKRGLSPRERHDEMVAGKYGITLVRREEYGQKDSDVTPQLTRLRNAPGFQAVFVNGFGQGALMATRNNNQLGKTIPLNHANAVPTDDFIRTT